MFSRHGKHAHPVDFLPDLGGIIIEKANETNAEVGPGVDLLRHHLPSTVLATPTASSTSSPTDRDTMGVHY